LGYRSNAAVVREVHEHGHDHDQEGVRPVSEEVEHHVPTRATQRPVANLRPGHDSIWFHNFGKSWLIELPRIMCSVWKSPITTNRDACDHFAGSLAIWSEKMAQKRSGKSRYLRNIGL